MSYPWLVRFTTDTQEMHINLNQIAAIDKAGEDTLIYLTSGTALTLRMPYEFVTERIMDAIEERRR